MWRHIITQITRSASLVRLWHQNRTYSFVFSDHCHIVTTSLPDAVLQYLRASQVTSLAKSKGGRNPLLMISFLRRVTLKAVIAARKSSVIAAADAPTRSGMSGRDQQDDQIHPVLRGSGPIPRSGRSRPERNLPERVQTPHATQPRTNLSWSDDEFPLMVHGPPLHITCTTTDLTHTSRPAVPSNKDAHCHHAVVTAAVWNFLAVHPFPNPTRPRHRYQVMGIFWTTGTYVSSPSTSQLPSTWHRTSPAQSTLSCNPQRFRSGQPLAPTPSHPLSWTKPSQHWSALSASLRIAGDSKSSPMELGGRPSMNTASRSWRELNQTGLKMQTVHQERGCTQPTRPAHDVRPKSWGPQIRHRDRGLLVTARRPTRNLSSVSPVSHRLSEHGLPVCCHSTKEKK